MVFMGSGEWGGGRFLEVGGLGVGCVCKNVKCKVVNCNKKVS